MLYLIPFLANLLLSGMYFALPVWSAAQGASVRFTSAMGLAVAVSYIGANLLLGHRLRPTLARRLMEWALLGMGALSALGLLVRTPTMALVLIAGFGLMAGLFFAPFQVAMRGAGGPPLPLSASVARYNVSWSSGMMVGVLLAGTLLARARLWVHVEALVICALTLAVVWRLPLPPPDDGAPATPHESHPADPFVVPRGDYLWLGWATILVQCYANATITFVFPKLGLQRGFSEAQLGLANSLMVLCQVGLTLVVWHARRLLYGPWPTLAVAGLGAAGVIGLARCPGYGANLLALAALGSASGISFFTAVYYANNHAEQGRAVGINESMVGVGMVCGPTAGALLGGQLSVRPYWLCAALFLLLAAATLALHSRRGRAA